MDSFSRKDFEALMQQQQSPCISLYLPTSRRGEPVQHNSAGLRKALRDIEHWLHLDDSAQSRQHALIKPLWELLSDEAFWAHPGDGLALFRSPELFRAYRLPLNFTQRLSITDHFFLLPLLPLLIDERFSILALSQNHVRLLACTHDSVHEQKLPKSVPHSFAAFTAGHQTENLLQYHSSASGVGRGVSGRQAVVFHGHGVGSDVPRDLLLHYCQRIDHGLGEYLHQHTEPLVLAGVDSLCSVYREANTYPSLLEEGIGGNPDHQRAAILRDLAWPLIKSSLNQDVLTAYSEFENAAQTSREIHEILSASSEGRVYKLLLDADATLWGTADHSVGTVQTLAEQAEGAEDLVERAAVQALLHGGDVYTLERTAMPDQAPIVALLRY